MKIIALACILMVITPIAYTQCNGTTVADCTPSDQCDFYKGKCFSKLCGKINFGLAQTHLEPVDKGITHTTDPNNTSTTFNLNLKLEYDAGNTVDEANKFDKLGGLCNSAQYTYQMYTVKQDDNQKDIKDLSFADLQYANIANLNPATRLLTWEFTDTQYMKHCQFMSNNNGIIQYSCKVMFEIQFQGVGQMEYYITINMRFTTSTSAYTDLSIIARTTNLSLETEGTLELKTKLTRTDAKKDDEKVKLGDIVSVEQQFIDQNLENLWELKFVKAVLSNAESSIEVANVANGKGRTSATNKSRTEAEIDCIFTGDFKIVVTSQLVQKTAGGRILTTRYLQSATEYKNPSSSISFKVTDSEGSSFSSQLVFGYLALFAIVLALL